jgi:hypothetical protein
MVAKANSEAVVDVDLITLNEENKPNTNLEDLEINNIKSNTYAPPDLTSLINNTNYLSAMNLTSSTLPTVSSLSLINTQPIINMSTINAIANKNTNNKSTNSQGNPAIELVSTPSINVLGSNHFSNKINFSDHLDTVTSKQNHFEGEKTHTSKNLTQNLISSSFEQKNKQNTSEISNSKLVNTIDTATSPIKFNDASLAASRYASSMLKAYASYDGDSLHNKSLYHADFVTTVGMPVSLPAPKSTSMTSLNEFAQISLNKTDTRNASITSQLSDMLSTDSAVIAANIDRHQTANPKPYQTNSKSKEDDEKAKSLIESNKRLLNNNRNFYAVSTNRLNATDWPSDSVQNKPIKTTKNNTLIDFQDNEQEQSAIDDSRLSIKEKNKTLEEQDSIKEQDNSQSKLLDSYFLKLMDKKLKRLIKKNEEKEIQNKKQTETNNSDRVALSWEISPTSKSVAHDTQSSSDKNDSCSSDLSSHFSERIPTHPYLPLRDVPIHELVKKLQQELETDKSYQVRNLSAKDLNSMWANIKKKVPEQKEEKKDSAQNKTQQIEKLKSLLKNPVGNLLETENSNSLPNQKVVYSKSLNSVDSNKENAQSSCSSEASTQTSFIISDKNNQIVDVNDREVDIYYKYENKKRQLNAAAASAAMLKEQLRRQKKEKIQELIQLQKQQHEKRERTLKKLDKLESLERKNLKKTIMNNQNDSITSVLYDSFFQNITNENKDRSIEGESDEGCQTIDIEALENELNEDLEELKQNINFKTLKTNVKKIISGNKLNDLRCIDNHGQGYDYLEAEEEEEEEEPLMTDEGRKLKSQVEILNLKNTSVHQKPTSVRVIKENQEKSSLSSNQPCNLETINALSNQKSVRNTANSKTFIPYPTVDNQKEQKATVSYKKKFYPPASVWFEPFENIENKPIRYSIGPSYHIMNNKTNNDVKNKLKKSTSEEEFHRVGLNEAIKSNSCFSQKATITQTANSSSLSNIKNYLNNKNSNNTLKAAEKISLQQAFEMHKSDLIMRSKKRQRDIQQKAEQRRTEAEFKLKQREELREIEAQMLREQKYNGTKTSRTMVSFDVANIKKSRNPLACMPKRQMTLEQIRLQTKRNYERLPEVRQMQIKKRVEEDKKLNRLKYSIYKKVSYLILYKNPKKNLYFMNKYLFSFIFFYLVDNSTKSFVQRAKF